MYEFKKTNFGFHVVMGGIYANNEIKSYIKEKEALIATIGKPFSILADLRTAYPPSSEDATLLTESHERLLSTDFERQAIIVSSPVLKGNAKQVMFRSELYKTTRIIDSQTFENWEELALGWVESSIEPNLNPVLTDITTN